MSFIIVFIYYGSSNLIRVLKPCLSITLKGKRPSAFIRTVCVIATACVLEWSKGSSANI